jgi:hypothetical protein
MGGKRLKLPEDVIRHWPEVFKNIEVKTIPLEYLQHIEVVFKNRKKWIIECNPVLSQKKFEKEIRDLFDQYGPDIRGVDFAIDTRRLKQDIQKGTQKVFKNAKIRK